MSAGERSQAVLRPTLSLAPWDQDRLGAGDGRVVDYSSVRNEPSVSVAKAWR